MLGDWQPVKPIHTPSMTMASDEGRPAARREAVCGAPAPLMSRRNLSCLDFLVSIIALVCVPYEAVYRPIHVLTRSRKLGACDVREHEKERTFRLACLLCHGKAEINLNRSQSLRSDSNSLTGNPWVTFPFRRNLSAKHQIQCI